MGWVFLRVNFNDDCAALQRFSNEDQSQLDANLTSTGPSFTRLPHSVRFTPCKRVKLIEVKSRIWGEKCCIWNSPYFAGLNQPQELTLIKLKDADTRLLVESWQQVPMENISIEDHQDATKKKWSQILPDSSGFLRSNQHNVTSMFGSLFLWNFTVLRKIFVAFLPVMICWLSTQQDFGRTC